MREFLLTGAIIALIVLSMGNPAQADPDRRVPCGQSGCHTNGRSGFTITGHDTMTDLGSGNLQTFTVEPGDTITLGTSVTDGHNKYAVVLRNFEIGGVEDSSHSLSFTSSSGWRGPAGENPPYYTSSSGGHSWSSTTQRNFTMTVDESTPPDYYLLKFELAGKNGGKWSQTRNFYLHVAGGAPKPGDGDIDGDGDVDFDDVALLGSKWGQQLCDVDNDFCSGSDIDIDGQVGPSDVMELAARWLMKKPLTIRVSGGNDDAEESLADSGVDLTSSDLELISDGSDAQLVGIRFNNVNVAPGAHIADAYIQFTVDDDDTDSGACSLVIHGQANDNPLAFVNSNGNISSRPTTTASVVWSPPAWNTEGQAGVNQQTPNLTAVIDEITARPGWSLGNSMVFIISGTGERTAESYDIPSAAPVLHILFDEPPAAATLLYSPNAATSIATDVTLSWLPGADAASHNIYFGTTNPPPFKLSQSAATFDPGLLVDSTVYYWKVDEVNFGGTTTGTVWSFTIGGR